MSAMVSTPEELLEKRREENLLRALESLTLDERRLFWLYHFCEGEQLIQSRRALCERFGISMNVLRIRVHRLGYRVRQHMAQLGDNAPTPAEEPNPLSPAPVSTQPTHRQKPLMDHLRYHLQTHFPVLYAQVLEPTLADLRQEHSDALAQERSLKARCVLLQGCGALVAAAVCQLGLSLLGRIAALWQARSSK